MLVGAVQAGVGAKNHCAPGTCGNLTELDSGHAPPRVRGWWWTCVLKWRHTRAQWSVRPGSCRAATSAGSGGACAPRHVITAPLTCGHMHMRTSLGTGWGTVTVKHSRNANLVLLRAAWCAKRRCGLTGPSSAGSGRPSMKVLSPGCRARRCSPVAIAAPARNAQGRRPANEGPSRTPHWLC